MSTRALPSAPPGAGIRATLWPILLAVLVGAAVPLVFRAVFAFGKNIPPHDLDTGYFVAVIWALVLGGGLFVIPLPGRDRTIMLALWGAKVAVTLGFELIYEAKYVILDAYFYFSEARQFDLVWNIFGLGDGTPNMILLTQLHNIVFPNSFHMLKVTWAMFGLLGVYAFYRAFVLFQGHENPRLLWVLGLFPSILFWSSTFGKDPLAMLSVGLYTYGFVAWRRAGRKSGIVWMLGAMLLAALIRLWLIPLLLTTLMILALLGVSGVWKRAAIVGVAAVLVGVAFQALLAKVGFDSIQDVIKAVDVVSKASRFGGSSQTLNFSSPSAMLMFLPFGMFTALFRPLPGDVMNAFGLLAGLENAVLVWLLVLAIRRTRLRELNSPLILCAIGFVVVWSMFYSIASYINLGGAARFKLQVLPLMLTLLLYFGRRRPPSAAAPAIPAR